MSAGSINLTNQFLIAMPGMAGDTFAGSVIYLCEHTEKGALGLVINKPIDIKLKNLFEKVELTLDRDDLAEAPVYFGGPVQTERGFVLHERLSDDGGHYNSSLQIPGGLEMTTSKDVLEAMWAGEGDVDTVIEKKGLKQITDSGAIEKVIEDVISKNTKQLEQYRGGKEALFGYFVGQVMKATGGKANPAQVNELLKKKLAGA